MHVGRIFTGMDLYEHDVIVVQVASTIHEFFFEKSSFIIMDDNALDEDFWSNHDTYTTLQDACLLHLTTKYGSIIYNV